MVLTPNIGLGELTLFLNGLATAPVVSFYCLIVSHTFLIASGSVDTFGAVRLILQALGASMLATESALSDRGVFFESTKLSAHSLPSDIALPNI